MKKDRLKKEIESWIWTIVVVIFIRAFFLQAYEIPTGSMEDTLLPGDFLLGAKFVYGLQIPYTAKKIIGFLKPKRGQIVIFNFPLNTRQDFVKRCIGLPGDTIMIINKVVYVNGKPLNEPYKTLKDSMHVIPPLMEVNSPIAMKQYEELWLKGAFQNERRVRDNFGPIVVPKGTYFVMGDNRDFSYDSRFWGPVPYAYLKGVPLITYLSINPDVPFYKIWKKIRFKRMFRLVLFY